MLLDNNKKQKKQKTKSKQSLQECIENFFNILYKNIIHDKMMLFYAELLVQKSMMQGEGRGGGGGGTLNEVLNNYDLTYLFIHSLKTLFETSTNR